MAKEKLGVIEKVLDTYDYQNLQDLIINLKPRGYNLTGVSVELNELNTLPDKTVVAVYGYIDSIEVQDFGRRLKRLKAKIYNNGEQTILFWIVAVQAANKVKFALEQQIKGDILIQATGKIASFTPAGGRRIMQIEQPKISPIANTGDGTKQNIKRMIPEPAYVLKGKTTVTQIQHSIRSFIKTPDIEGMLPEELAKDMGLKGLITSLRYMHGLMPIDREKLETFLTYPDFNKRLDIEKIWKILKLSKENANDNHIPSIKLLETDKQRLNELNEALPFELTGDQKKTIWGLLSLFAEKSGTRSLIFGDVGSGKTLVSLYSAEVLRNKGFQVAIMAPTSILAKQHFEEATALIGKKNIVFVSTKTTASARRKINERLANRESLIVFGTSTLNSLKFSNLKMIVIDEEQKLGVRAKEKLYEDFSGQAHIVFMTATPIPRTLAAAIFTDYSVFQIKEKPKGVQERDTQIFYFRDTAETTKVVADIQARLDKGEQVLSIAPSIKGDDMVNVEGVMKKYAKYFPGQEIRSIHGKMKKAEVEKEIEAYMKGEFPILVATSMVDSGFSNKNITSVLIEGCERFGVAQLHQMRGRCGRGQLKGYCYLCPSNKSLKEHTVERLNAICSSEDGFWLSEQDILLRGSGEVDGEIQSGKELNFIEYQKEIKSMKEWLEEK